MGPELAIRAWERLKDTGPVFVLIAPPEWMARHGAPIAVINEPGEAAGAFTHALPILPIATSGSTAPIPGAPIHEHAPTVLRSIEWATELALQGKTLGVVTNPIAKHVLYEAGFTSPGHTEFLSELTGEFATLGPRGPVMMLANAHLRVALVTIHLPLRDVPDALSEESVKRCIRVTHHALRSDFGITAPRIAMCGLNPHAGENGAMGTEEIALLNPLAEQLRSEGISVTNAQSADTLFTEDARKGYDAAIAMYHDQGLGPIKTLDFHGAVNITLGLPIVRTSPDHGSGFAIAGKGLARPDSLIAALRMGADMAARRHAQLVQSHDP